jgi:hypothetical protein
MSMAGLPDYSPSGARAGTHPAAAALGRGGVSRLASASRLHLVSLMAHERPDVGTLGPPGRARNPHHQPAPGKATHGQGRRRPPRRPAHLLHRRRPTHAGHHRRDLQPHRPRRLGCTRPVAEPDTASPIPYRRFCTTRSRRPWTPPRIHAVVANHVIPASRRPKYGGTPNTARTGRSVRLDHGELAIASRCMSAGRRSGRIAIRDTARSL